MKTLISFILNLAVLTVYANDLFLYETSSPFEMTEVINNKLVEVTPITGKTTTIKNNLSLKTTNNVTYMFPHRVVINHSDVTSVYFTESDVTYDTNTIPNIVKLENSTLILSVTGECYVVNDSENTVMVGTPMANIQFNKSKVFIKSGDKYTHVYNIEGKITVFDSKSRKKKELKEKDYLVITPQISMNPRDAKLTIGGNSFSVKEVDEDEVVHHTKETSILQSKLDNVLFINHNKEVFGIKLK